MKSNLDTLFIYTTLRCSNRCKECNFDHKNDQQTLSLTSINEVLSKITPKNIVFSDTDIVLNPEFVDIIHFTKSLCPDSIIAIKTDISFLTPDVMLSLKGLVHEISVVIDTDTFFPKDSSLFVEDTQTVNMIQMANKYFDTVEINLIFTSKQHTDKATLLSLKLVSDFNINSLKLTKLLTEEDYTSSKFHEFYTKTQFSHVGTFEDAIKEKRLSLLPDGKLYTCEKKHFGS